MVRFLAALALLALSTPVLAAQPTASAPPSPRASLSALLGAAVTATDDERYCDALYLFEALHLRAPSARALYNAAEVAFAAGDRVKALDLYRTTQRLYPEEKKDIIQQRADAVFAAMVKAGPGTACAVRADVCGDWLLRPIDQEAGGEACDDGNLDDGDGCDHDCSLTACGNGVVTAGEACDDGNDEDGDGCDGNCRVSACGNGVRAGAEACDDGNDQDGDGCDHGCVLTGCGNGVRTDGEECDDGNDDDGDGCDSGCRLSRCGNGRVTGLEQCDDGNAVSGDGCEVDCTRTRAKRPLPGAILAGLSGAGLLGGVGLFALGTTPFGDHQAALADLAAAEAAFADDPGAALVAADDARARADSARLAAQSWAGPALVGGALLAAAGAVGVGAGLWFAFTDTEIAGGAQ